MHVIRMDRRPGYTLLEVLLVVGIIGVIASMFIVAISPSRQLRDAENVKRKVMIREQQNAIMQYVYLEEGNPVSGLDADEENAMPICREGVTNASCVGIDALVPQYLVAIPVDVLETDPIRTGYRIYQGLNLRPTICSDYLPVDDELRCSGSTYDGSDGGGTDGETDGTNGGDGVLPPSIITLTPLDNATGVSIGTNLTIEFSEAVNPVSGDVTIKLQSNGAVVEAIDVSSNRVTGGGTETITINPVSDLASNTSYYVTIDATAFDDFDGNGFAGISYATTWNFQTETVGCFLAGTMVRLVDGSEKPIETLTTSDVLLGHDGLGWNSNVVEKVMTPRTVEGYYELTVDGHVLSVTSEHPFYVGNGAFGVVRELHVGDTLYVYRDGALVPRSLEKKTFIDEPTVVYNVQTGGSHTYVADSVLVHNKSIVDETGLCTNGVDDDADGQIDCADSNCSADPACSICSINGVCGSGEICWNDCPTETGVACMGDGVDNDSDGTVDCADSDCSGVAICGGAESVCNDGIDNDLDAMIDCFDSDCSMDPACMGGASSSMGSMIITAESACSDLMDNDADMLIDCADSDCAMDPACMGDGMGL